MGVSPTRSSSLNPLPRVSAPPTWHEAMRLDQASPPLVWREWRRLHKGVTALAFAPEWASEWIVYWSRHWDLPRALELLGRFTLLVTIIAALWAYINGLQDQARIQRDTLKAKHYRAWELINSARGSPGDGGRRYALHDLAGDGISLAGVPLSSSTLPGLRLPPGRR
jgi:hypothetical protein